MDLIRKSKVMLTFNCPVNIYFYYYFLEKYCAFV